MCATTVKSIWQVFEKWLSFLFTSYTFILSALHCFICTVTCTCLCYQYLLITLVMLFMHICKYEYVRFTFFTLWKHNRLLKYLFTEWIWRDQYFQNTKISKVLKDAKVGQLQGEKKHERSNTFKAHNLQRFYIWFCFPTK